MEKRDDFKIEDKGITKITDEKTQIAIRIPAEIRDKFRINPIEDGIQWLILKTEGEISLQAQLVKGAFKDEKENNKSKNK